MCHPIFLSLGKLSKALSKCVKMKILICLKSMLASYVNHQLFLNVRWLLSIWWRHWPQPHFYSLKMSENQIFSDACRGYTKQKLDSDKLIWLNWVIGSRPRQHPLVLQWNHQNDLNHKHIKIAQNVKTQNTLLDFNYLTNEPNNYGFKVNNV